MDDVIWCVPHDQPVLQVVPFSPSSGLLQWVEDTMPLMDYLTGPDRSSGAHARYMHAGDLLHGVCSNTMFRAKHQERRQKYDQVEPWQHCCIPMYD